MVFGFAAATVAGFLLTAIPNWTGRMPLQGGPLAVLAVLWLSGRVAMLLSSCLGAGATAALDLAFPLAFLGVIAREITIPKKCNVTNIFYTGDMGGILCGLDIGGAETKNAHVVSITHLAFDRRVPLSREISAYQRHRIKKLKQQQGRGY